MCAKKLNAVIAAKKYSIIAVTKICCILRTALTTLKCPKFGREEKLFSPLQRCRKTRLNRSNLNKLDLSRES
ncbi:hypothetical protein [Wolbachia endosymbiont of Litomosoides brasiliensis]|uniref:hypothetical protein n=1 Tax=Wolbachia endosymbiont of Litomosoides brasiliensis TaxID=1812117 RepID=UPI00397AB744